MNCNKLAKLSWMLMFSAFVACVDEYDVIPESYTDPMLVVDGTIYGNQDCLFTLHHTIHLDESYLMALQGVPNATVSVCGSQGERFECTSASNGEYVVPVGTLSAGSEYWVEIDASGYGSFKSTPMKPLYAPAIENLTYKRPNTDEGQVEFLVTTSDMGSGEARKSYFLWRYEECYAINTPIIATYYYDPETDEILPLTQSLRHGWKEIVSGDCIIASNEDFNYGAIRNYCIYQKSNQDYRFMERYRTCVYQEAISAEEYEYRHLVEIQTSNMGGLFTPMPAELPSNVYGTHGEKCIGFVGVRGSVESKYIYVNRKDVGYHYSPRFDTYETVKSKKYMYNMGYRVASYFPMNGESSLEWTMRWVVDVTDKYWGASLTAPDYWEEAVED